MKGKDRKIVFVNQATGYLTVDIVNAFADEFDDVALIAGSIRLQDISLRKKVKCLKIVKYCRENAKNKILSWIVGTIQIFAILAFRFQGYEIFYITVPPTNYLLSLILPNKYSILIFDIFPDALKIFNVKETHILYRLWKRWNRKIFRDAHRIYTLGNSMKNVLCKYAQAEKIEVINNWSGFTNISPVPKNKNPFIEQQGISGKFVVQYSGNIGHTHNIEPLLALAEEYRHEPDVIFVIIGRGDQYASTKNTIERNKMLNCRILPFLPDSEILNSLSAADLSVVVLDEKVAACSVPSKIYNLLAVGSPIMVIGGEKNELVDFIAGYNVGRAFKPMEISEMSKYIRELKTDTNRKNMLRNNALQTAGFFTSKNAKYYLESYLKQIS